MDKDNYFNVGKIVNTQGLKGDVRVVPSTFDIKRFELLDEVYLIDENKRVNAVFKIEKVWYHKQFVIIKFIGIDNMTEAEKLKDVEIMIPEDLALPLEANEYYIRDIYGLNVFTNEEEFLGEIIDIIFTGSNDVYVVKKDNKTILIPAIKKCILDIDIKSKKMIVNLLEGLR